MGKNELNMTLSSPIFKRRKIGNLVQARFYKAFRWRGFLEKSKYGG